MAWCKLHTDIIGDPKLLRAARKGARHLHWLPWLIAFAKAADDDGRLTVNGEPAEPEDIAPQLPGATIDSVRLCMDELESISVLYRDMDGALAFTQWEARSGRRASEDGEAVAERVRKHRAQWDAERKAEERVKEKARGALRRAMQRGEVTPQPCQECGAKQADPHHLDYTEPLKVEWLCRSHHKIRHASEQKARGGSRQPIRNGRNNSSVTADNDASLTRDNATEVEVEVEVEKREMENGNAPRPLASASTETEPLDDPEPRYLKDGFNARMKLPAEASKFVDELYGLSTVRRREDVRRQLYDAIDPSKRGAFLRRGVYVKAKDADHLARVCTAVRLDPPQQLDSAIVYVLRKLQDAETDANGRTVTEAASFDQKQTDALLERYEKAAKAAANEWVKSNREAYAAITARLGVQFPGATTDAAADGWIRIAYDGAHLSEVRKASGFPDFETWRASLNCIAKVG